LAGKSLVCAVFGGKCMEPAEFIRTVVGSVEGKCMDPPDFIRMPTGARLGVQLIDFME